MTDHSLDRVRRSVAVIGLLAILLVAGISVNSIAGSGSGTNALGSASPRATSAASSGRVAAPAAPGGGSGACNGPWPAFAGDGPFPTGCPGRDEAVVGFYSPIPGGAGNVSIQLTLPVDRAPTGNQSDLYRSVWLGLVLADPAAWMGECLLEVGFQPDSAWNAGGSAVGPSPNNWSGSLVGWQFDPSTGTEDTCVDQPLSTISGSNATDLPISGGDTLNITTVGWIGSPIGETVTVVDATSGATSTVRGLADDGVPLDPAFSTSTALDAFPGSVVAVPPVSFGVELAGGANPSIPTNSSFGGCTPGLPPATPTDPAVPCPSYDPLSWINDTAAPIRLAPPVFANATSAVRTDEFLFASGIGGPNGLDALSNATCDGRLGSSYCTYPWYSFSCGAGALEFGASDYSGVTTDFGEGHEYPSSPVANLLGYDQFPAGQFAVPGCGAGAQNVTTGVSAGAGVVQLLGSNFTAPTPELLPPGEYLITALPAPASYFDGWAVTGSASVASAAEASTTLFPGSGGTVTARFTTSPVVVNVTFAASGQNGSFELGALGGSNVTPATPIAAGTAVPLPAGSYPLQVDPGVGSAFAAWTTHGPAAVLDPSGAATWLVVPSSGGTATVDATLDAVATNATLDASVSGNGTVTLNGVALPYDSANLSSAGSATSAAGTFQLSAVPAPGWVFLGWTVLPGGVAIFGGENETNVTISSGVGYAIGSFAALVTVVASPADGGAVSLDGATPVGSGTVLPLTVGVHALGAAPAGGFAFAHWQATPVRSLLVARAGLPLTKLTVNGSGVLNVTFSPAPNETVTFAVSPAAAGTIQFNFRNLTMNLTTNSSVVNTTYELKSFASYGFRFLGWNVTGPAQTPAGELVVNGTGAVVTARFGIKFFPVTFVETRPSSVTLKVNGVSEPSGTTLTLARGVYNLSATVTAANTTFLGWSSGLPIGNVSSDHTTATVTVTGPGAVSGLVAAFVLQGLTISPSTVDVGAASHLTVFASGAGPLTYRYLGLPPGCTSANRGTLTCRATAAGTYPIRASVADSSGALATTSSVLLTIVGDPILTRFSVSPGTTDVTHSVTIASTVQQGLAPYTYTYTGLPPGCAAANSPNLTCRPTGTGTFDVRLTVNDSDGLVATANATLTVHPNPSISSVTFSAPVVDVGVPTTLTVVASGGTGPLAYSYSGLPSGCAAGTGATIDCIPTAVGSSNVTVTITDQVGQTAQATGRLTVHARPAVTAFTIAPSTIVLGQSVQLTVVASGGTGGLGYGYSGLPAGCTSTNSSTFTCAPSVAGAFTVTVEAFDPFGANGTGTAHLTVTAPSTGPAPSGSSSTGIVWWIVAVFGVVALVVAIALVFVFGRPPQPR